MRTAALHTWQVTPTQAIAIQRQVAQRVERTGELTPSAVRYIAGVDVSSTKYDRVLTAGVVVCDATSMAVVERASAQVPAEFPYIPGLLSFREIPALLQAISQLTHRPDVYMVDGQGIAHPRRLGIASHIGVLLNQPAIGVAKSPLVGGRRNPGADVGSIVPLVDHSEVVGSVVRTKLRANPLYISVGHRVSLDVAVALVMRSCRGYRLPQPTRLAHLYVNEVRKASLAKRPLF